MMTGSEFACAACQGAGSAQTARSGANIHLKRNGAECRTCRGTGICQSCEGTGVASAIGSGILDLGLNKL
jgi:DnaJ-class molecular chaperone